MPFLGSHSVAGLALGTTPFSRKVPRRIWWLAPLCAAIPDLDTLWSFGMQGSHAWYAHRGITHTPAFAVVLAFVVLRAAFPEVDSPAERRRIWLALFLATVSHGLLDALSTPGPGIPFLFPFSTERFKFAWLPIRANPNAFHHGVVRLLLKSIGPELLWIWIPSLALLGLTALRRRASVLRPERLGAVVAIALLGDHTVEQTSQGNRPSAVLVASFDGLGQGFAGPQGTANLRSPSDNSLAVGPDHIVQIVNSRMAIFTKRGSRFDSTGKALYGPVETRNVFRGFGGPCEARNNGDAVVRYDQLANRWLIVMPIFTRGPTRPDIGGHPGPAVRLFEPPPPPPPTGPATPPVRPTATPTGSYAMCYALSTGPDPFGPYYRYEFTRSLFPDYPRPAVWPDGYYVATSTGDEVIQKHACVVDRLRMLEGKDATEQCVVIDSVNFLNNADLDGTTRPPAGAPNILLAAGGTQLQKRMEDSVIYAWSFHVDWEDTSRTRLSGPVKLPVAPYHYLCDGQLTSCVSQPGTDRRLDAQGDKLMARVVYRRIGKRESLVAVHSVNTATGGGGVRWYELRLDNGHNLQLYQQGTYAPDSFYRWMASPAIDAKGNIGIGYSFGGAPNFVGQRFAGRRAGDPKGVLSLRETVLVEGQAAQTNTLRWEDYSQTAMDPSDDCTIWYVGDYLKHDATSYSTRIGAFRLPGCSGSGGR